MYSKYKYKLEEEQNGRCTLSQHICVCVCDTEGFTCSANRDFLLVLNQNKLHNFSNLQTIKQTTLQIKPALFLFSVT